MWVRSQDGKELIKGERIWIDSRPNLWARIYTVGHLLGEYASEAEALEVLDLMVTQHDMDVYEHGPEGMRVFQMPPKGFSKAGGDNHGTD
jgi:hypothetical protein